MGCVCDCITWLVILLKNALYLSISAKQSKNRVLTRTMGNIICLNGMSKLTDPIDAKFSILNVKLANLAVFLLSWIEVSICYNAFNWLMPSVDQIKIPELINNPLNSMLLYHESGDELKI